MKWSKLPVLCNENWCLLYNGLNSDLWVDNICNSSHANKVIYDLIPTCSSGSVLPLTFSAGDIHNTAYKYFDKTYYAGNGSYSCGSCPCNRSYLNQPVYLTYTFENDVIITKWQVFFAASYMGSTTGDYHYYNFEYYDNDSNSWKALFDSDIAIHVKESQFIPSNETASITKKIITNKIRIKCIPSSDPGTTNIYPFYIDEWLIYGRNQ